MGGRAVVAAEEHIAGADDFTQHLLDTEEDDPPEPLTFEKIASYLVREPFNCSIAQIANLNDYQIWQIYFRPRPEDDSDEERESMEDRYMVAQMTAREAHVAEYKKTFVELWEQEGLTPEQIEAKWQESEVGRTQGQRSFGSEAERGNPSGGSTQNAN